MDFSPELLTRGCTVEIDGEPISPASSASVEFRLESRGQGSARRFRFTLGGTGRLTKSGGSDAVCYLSVETPGRAKEIRLGEFDEQTHCFRPVERRLTEPDFEAGLACDGPILAWSEGGTSRLLAFEHGSQSPDAFLRYHLHPGGRVTLVATRGNYAAGHDLGEHPFVSPWFHALEVAGGLDELAAAYRDFLLRAQASHPASRRPQLFYNTWNHQERNRHWRGKPYLAEMNEQRMLEEIRVAAEIGIETFVIDTGWYDKTGDWRVSRERFPRGMEPIRRELERHGMELGLWFNPVVAGESSRMFLENRGLAMTLGGELPQPHPVWETEPAYGMCLCTGYADLFADELIRLHRETGVTYFKWDAIGQYGCDSPDHGHGTADNPPQERRECYGYQLPQRMAYVVDRLAEACPGATVDFDVTEGGRAFGLGFLASGKFFLLNNGPYYFNYDAPTPPDGFGGHNANLFFQPGLAQPALSQCLRLRQMGAQRAHARALPARRRRPQPPPRARLRRERPRRRASAAGRGCLADPRPRRHLGRPARGQRRRPEEAAGLVGPLEAGAG